MAFTLRRDTNGVPVAGYQDSADAVDVLCYAPTRVIDEIKTTDANGFFWTNSKPILDYDRDSGRAVTSSDIVAKKTDNTTLYIGTVDAKAGKVELFSDASKTIKYTNQQAKLTYSALIPLKSTSDGQVVIYSEQLGSVINSGNLKTIITSQIPAGNNVIGKVVLDQPAIVTPNLTKVTALEASVITEAGNTRNAPIDVSEYRQIIAFMNVSQVSGVNPAFTCKIETYDDVSEQWLPIAIFDSVTEAPNTQQKTLCYGFGDKIAISWTVSGTSISFTVNLGIVLRN
ncbi:hypothetical protein [Tepidanaerobacter syntrophicus]|uniref:hypothetical protein n=1 Tax=Tepidanaerobacter syntrophicus TaxID=224999 RepID=UPI001BD30D82|nr:hypothetical protein [Tepidanaerobacter syntrophicus]